MSHETTSVSIPSDALLKMIERLLRFRYAEICRHMVAADLLSILEQYGFPVTKGLAEAIVNANDEESLALLSNIYSPVRHGT
jgi:hypothetical protein